MESQKILLVGDPRICPQVAYVMDWQNFAQVEQLTDAEKYRDYKIVICDFKSNRQKYVPPKGVIYLDDICDELDAEQNINTLRKGIRRVPLIRRFTDRVKNHDIGRAILRLLKHKITFRNYDIIKHLPTESLQLSEMFIKVLYSKPTKIVCDELLVNLTIDGNFNLSGCVCSDWVSTFGNLGNAELSAVYHSRRARIVKLSALNHSYCFCNLQYCQRTKRTSDLPVILSPLITSPMPQRLALAFDSSCNLNCIMCRTKHYTADSGTQGEINAITNKLLTSTWLNDVPYLTLAGDGEVFYSKAYRNLLFNYLKRKQIHILSNGLLFTKECWTKLNEKYEIIDVTISVDAASAATYQKIRGGNFATLIDNLTMLGHLRQSRAIRCFSLHFVVQDNNCDEMVAFVKLAKALHVDHVIFIRLNKGGTFTKGRYRKVQKSLSRKLPMILQNQIFNDPIVDLTSLQPYLAASAKRYGE